MNDPRSSLIVALDVPDRAAAIQAVDRLAGHVGFFKVGLEIFTREGPPLVEQIRKRGENVFLDLKLHDIPNTVRGAVRSACRLGVQMLTVHASGGPAMLEGACEEAQSSSSPPLLLAVTALTSLSPEDVRTLGIGGSIEDWVEKLALMAYGSGIRGIVASTKELPMLHRKFQGEMKLVIPGIRPAGSAQQDQARTATPGEAIRSGADFIVVGRPILQAHDPASAADAIVADIRQALSKPA
ncbi:MAG: orotidine-5'-phosphate decarboxylase [Acidobacteria bacterium]|nr:orotidine-5'-phosphate decarboxylase [Acidobacteriota bacterium]